MSKHVRDIPKSRVDNYRSINALAETTNGLYKAEAIRDDSPFRTGPLAPSLTSRPSPRPGWPGTTTTDSCTDSAADPQQSTKPNTMNKPSAAARSRTHNQVRTKPGTVQSQLV